MELEGKARLADAWHYGRPYRWRYLAGIITIFIVDALEMVAPVAVAVAVGMLSGQIPRGWLPTQIHSLVGDSINWLCALVIIVLILQFFLRYAWRVFFIFTREYIAEDLRRDYFHKLTILPQSFYNRAQTGELMSLASNDVDAVRMMMGIGTLLFFDGIAYFVFVLILLFSWHVELTLYLLCIIPVVPICVFYFSRQIHIRFQLVQKQLALLSAQSQEAFAGVGVIKNFVREKSEVERFAQESKIFLDYNLSLARIQALFWPLMVFFVGVEALVVMVVGGSAVAAGDLQLGEFIGFFLALWLLTWPTVCIGWVINMYQKGMASMGRIKSILEYPIDPENTDPSLTGDDIQGDLKVDKVTFTYPETSAPALDEVSFAVERGKTVAIVGAVGSGKSTLLRLLLKIYPIDQGEIELSGRSIKDFPASLLRRQLGYMPQENFLFSTTISQNIALGMDREEEDAVRWAAEMACINKEIEEFPTGYQTLLGEKGVNLSGGQKQRVAIARALAMQPKILVLDDCLSSVDTRTEEKILTNLRQVREGCTAIIATHRLTAVKDADLILVMEHGKIVHQGTHAQLMEVEDSWYSHTYQQQLLERKLEEGENE